MVDLLIPGPEGKIEARYTHNNNDKSPIALILHPDPSRGGSMNTKVIFRLYKLFVNNGFSTIRFNFRGVGKSEGLFDDGEGELSDAASVLDWIQQYNTNSKIVWVAISNTLKPPNTPETHPRQFGDLIYTVYIIGARVFITLGFSNNNIISFSAFGQKNPKFLILGKTAPAAPFYVLFL